MRTRVLIESVEEGGMLAEDETPLRLKSDNITLDHTPIEHSALIG